VTPRAVEKSRVSNRNVKSDAPDSGASLFARASAGGIGEECPILRDPGRGTAALGEKDVGKREALIERSVTSSASAGINVARGA